MMQEAEQLHLCTFVGGPGENQQMLCMFRDGPFKEGVPGQEIHDCEPLEAASSEGVQGQEARR